MRYSPRTSFGHVCFKMLLASGLWIIYTPLERSIHPGLSMQQISWKHTCHKLWTEICEMRQIFKGDLIKFCEIFTGIMKILWDLKNLTGTGFQMGQILWDFISHCEIFTMWDMACMWKILTFWFNGTIHNAPQILGTWSRGRQALAIGNHNLTQNNGKSNLISHNWSKVMPKRIGNNIAMIFSSCTCKRQDGQNWYS